MSVEHVPVLKDELIASLNLRPDSVVIDCTTGLGGHIGEVLKVVSNGKVIGLDRDSMAIATVKQKLSGEIASGRLQIVNTAFSHLAEVCKTRNLTGEVDAIYADLGVSTLQLATDFRGFSFQHEGPLDMRMDTSGGTTAADLVNNSTDRELSDIFWRYGEERFSRQIARAIVDERSKQKIETTTQLAKIVEKVSFKKSKIHPATKVFQALRIAVNDELGELETVLRDSFEALAPKGRLALITFHSLEDRIVKQFFKGLAEPPTPHRSIPLRGSDLTAAIKAKIIKPFPIKPSDKEIKFNPKSRSAKLRVLEKI
ncbi:MAG: 16S rRNA (cytosine(1402)-N(4))-methyltransferase RsmH [Oligoflexales bacterium]